MLENAGAVCYTVSILHGGRYMNKNFYGIAPFGSLPNERQLSHFKIGKKAFFHFGVNTFSDKEWGDGKEAEKLLDPTDKYIREWIRDVKAAGFKLAIITAKHHDGFCLWPSKYTEHSVKNSPYKNGKGDIIREFTDACREFGIKAGIYISPWDRNAPFWGTDDYSFYYAKQLEELVTEYGKIDEIWWDGAGSSETRYDWGMWADIIRKNQPDAVIFGSIGATPYVDMRWVGNEAGYAGKTHYASINASSLEVETASELNVGKIGGDRYIPAEVDVSIRPGWFYHKEQDDMVKSARELDNIWFRSVGNNAIMLLNFPPDRRGRLVRRDVENAIESDRRINEMLASGILDKATVSADSQYCNDTGIKNAVLANDELFYASGIDKPRAVIEIDAIANSAPFNTLILGEMVELGERITAFKLENLDGDEPEILYTGTSVGYLRAVKFKSGAYKKLRLTIEGITAPVTLRTLSLNAYDEEKNAEGTRERVEITSLSSAECIIADDGKSAVIMFGGIFPFDRISFMTRGGSEYRVYAFDGSKYYPIAEGKASTYRVSIELDEPITSSYQIKIESSRGFQLDPQFSVS